MNSRLFFLAFAAIVALSGAQANNSTSPICGNATSINTTAYACGKNYENKTYSTGDTATICLFFDQLDPVQKVVFTPKVDVFQSLQIKGLYNYTDNDSQQGDRTVTAMANGVMSRQAVFKKNKEVAPILNLIVGLDKGKISKLEWRNTCFDGQGCQPNDCKDSSAPDLDGTCAPELNCFRSDCEKLVKGECDTQFFVTWVGRDNDKDDCTSDNYRITGFTNFNIVSYLESAWGLVGKTFSQDFGTPAKSD